uniref:Uncharacterized protein n=1 Tax=Bursaphelenchus xylophilus TaxID=6326 RepID=A0A1I7SG32_BURXY
MDNIRFDTSFMTRIFLMLHLEASDFWTKNGVIKKQKDGKRNFQMTGNFNSPMMTDFPGILLRSAQL